MSQHNVTIIANRGGGDLDEAMTEAIGAALAVIMKNYRMAGFPAPFGSDGDRYYHLFVEGAHLALCQGMAVARPGRMPPADLTAIDCVACLHEFAEGISGHA